MPDFFADIPLDTALRQGLQAQPVPATSADFDARVLLALQRPQPWWSRLWPQVQPVLIGASCSLGLTLALLHWSLAAPLGPLPLPAPPVLASRPTKPLPSLDALLDRPNLSVGSLTLFWVQPPPLPERHFGPRRHAQRLFPSLPVA